MFVVLSSTNLHLMNWCRLTDSLAGCLSSQTRSPRPQNIVEVMQTAGSEIFFSVLFYQLTVRGLVWFSSGSLEENQRSCRKVKFISLCHVRASSLHKHMGKVIYLAFCFSFSTSVSQSFLVMTSSLVCVA